MKALIASCARLFKTPDGVIYTPVVYGYDFYKRYLDVFDELIVAGFCDAVEKNSVANMLRVSGPRISFFELPYPHGEWDYIKKRIIIKKMIMTSALDCDLMILRVPDTLCFLLMERAIRDKMVFGLEVTSDPLNLYTRRNYKSKFFFVYKYYYYHKLRKACRYATGTSYVTQYGLQIHYPPSGRDGSFTTFYTNADIKVDANKSARELPTGRQIRFIHVAVSIGGVAKGHREVLRAFGELVQEGYAVQLVLVGGGKLTEENQDYIQAHDLEKHIIFKGKITPVQVTEELDQADIFIFPSYNEGLPRVVVEAMGRGLPIIASDIPAHRELLPTEYLAPVENSEKLVEIAKSLLDSPEKYAQASLTNLIKAKEYDIELIREKRIRYYSQLKRAAENKREK